MIEFRSDNSAGVAPEILEAIAAANVGPAPAYGADEHTAQLQQVVREVFEHETAQVFPVTSGTAANALALSAMCPPWGAILCHDTAHILHSEAGATSLLSGGAQMQGVAGPNALMAPTALRDALDSIRWGDPHHSQPAVLSFTQPSDLGTIYRCSELAELTEIARHAGLRVHLDGARLANAIVALGCAPADITWRAGVDVVSLGATKNGALSSEAIVVFDEAIADELIYRTKRAGHVSSKMRFQSAQVTAYLTDELWLRLASNSNTQMRDLAAGLRALAIPFVQEPSVNMLFAEVSDTVADQLEAGGLQFHRSGNGIIRLVTSWQTSSEDTTAALDLFGRVLAA